jgi:hypothetical protein
MLGGAQDLNVIRSRLDIICSLLRSPNRFLAWSGAVAPDARWEIRDAEELLAGPPCREPDMAEGTRVGISQQMSSASFSLTLFTSFTIRALHVYP